MTSLCRRKEPDGLVTATITKQGRVLGTPPSLTLVKFKIFVGIVARSAALDLNTMDKTGARLVRALVINLDVTDP
jgi:hypothetical protein